LINCQQNVDKGGLLTKAGFLTKEATACEHSFEQLWKGIFKRRFILR
jgi:hypothetical protein